MVNVWKVLGKVLGSVRDEGASWVGVRTGAPTVVETTRTEDRGPKVLGRVPNRVSSTDHRDLSGPLEGL